MKTMTEIIECAFLGYLTSEGQTYCTVYDASLNNEARGILIHGEDGTLQRDVWSQVSFMTPEEFAKIQNS